MELNIINILKQLRQSLRRKPKCVVEQPKPPKPKKVKAKPEPKRKIIKVNIEGVCLSLPEVAQKYKLDIATVRARYRVGNKGKLLIRPTPKSHTKG
jgi:anthranilate/para-aminobenzoate synthase component II